MYGSYLSASSTTTGSVTPLPTQRCSGQNQRKNNEHSFRTTLYVFDKDYRVARSALWGLPKATNEELSKLQVILDELIEQSIQTENSSLRRLTLNIIERLKMNEEDLRTDFLDFCLEHMVSIEEFPGVQTLCMKLAYRMCSFYPELMDELKRTLEMMEIEYYKPAVKGLRQRILSGKYR